MERLKNKKTLLVAGIGLLVIAVILFYVAVLKISQDSITEDASFLTAAESWYHYDEITGENEVMRFQEDHSFYWGCACGEPVGNSDLLERYEFDLETSKIKLYNDYDDFNMEAEVLHHSDHHLLLKIDGEIKDYTSIESGIDIEESEKYLSGYSGEFNTLGVSDAGILLGPFNYDGDVEYPDDAFMTCGLHEDAEVYLLDIYTQIRDGETVRHDVEYRPLGASEAAPYMEQGTAFVWFDETLKITKLLFYGEVIVEE